MSNGYRSPSLSSLRHMPVIIEDDDLPEPFPEPFPDSPTLPALPPRSEKRTSVGRSVGTPSSRASEPTYPPPAYSRYTTSTSSPLTETSDETDPSDEPVKEDKRPNWLIKRGGWRRIACYVLLLLICVIALVVGLTLGLTLKKPNGGPPPPKPSSSPSPNNLFPAGSYSFITSLNNVSTGCTSSPATFRCYPFTTYGSSVGGSSATYFWTIQAVNDSAYVISAASNPFVPQFSNLPLTRLSVGDPDERMTFSFPMTLSVAASGTVGSTAATCFYNNTIMSATIWTRRQAAYPANLTTPVSNGGDGTMISTKYDAWPYAVEITQLAEASTSTPDCRDSRGNPVGSFAVPSGECGCWYLNFGLGS